MNIEDRLQIIWNGTHSSVRKSQIKEVKTYLDNLQQENTQLKQKLKEFDYLLSIISKENCIVDYDLDYHKTKDKEVCAGKNNRNCKSCWKEALKAEKFLEGKG